MKRILNKLFSKLVLGGLIIILQFSWFVYLLYSATVYSSMVDALFKIASIVLALFVSSRDMRSTYKTSWIFLILALPLFGIPAYYLFGRPGLTKRTRMKMDVVSSRIRAYSSPSDDVMSALRAEDDSVGQQAQYLTRYAGYPVYREADTQYYCCGEEMYPQFLEDLKTAKSYIFLEYFIVEEGYMWGSVLEILKEKAAAGVEVRFMYDGMCSISLLPPDYPKKIRRFGIQCKMFSPIRPVLSTTQNNRDHRKICVIDGKTGFTGGINLGDEYINRKERFGYWKDTAVMIKGDAVQSLTMLFLQMWNVSELKKEKFEPYLTTMAKELKPETGFVLPYGDSPYDHENVGEEVYVHILNHAKKYVHIMTPYLILDNGMLDTLTRAAKSGIEVCIIMPHIPDKWYAFAVAKTYYRELIEAGVNIYEFTPGFVHAKVFVSDDDTATVGTVNLDYRSLYLHFECGIFVYDNPVVHKIEKDFQETLKKSCKVTASDIGNTGIFMRICGRVLRLIAPLM